MRLTSPEGRGSTLMTAVATARQRLAAFIRARVLSPMRACPRGDASENPASAVARAVIAGVAVRGVRVRERRGERS